MFNFLTFKFDKENQTVDVDRWTSMIEEQASKMGVNIPNTMITNTVQACVSKCKFLFFVFVFLLIFIIIITTIIIIITIKNKQFQILQIASRTAKRKFQ